VLLALFIFSTAAPLFAADEEEFMLEEITVTAEKREAQLQKIPMDIAVIRPDDMERLNIREMTDLDKMMPDVDIKSQRGGEVVIELREVEPGMYTNPSAETTVAVHIDGVQLTRSDGLEGKIYDLERVETLKGPQGTLYGRGSTAGSMNLISKKPDIGEFGGNITVEYGSYNRRRVEGALNIPATDTLAFRLSGRSLTRDGFDDLNLSNQDSWGFRGSMRWEPTDTQSLVIAIDTDRTQNKMGDSTGIYYSTFGNVQIVENTAITDPTSPQYDPLMAPYAKGGDVRSPYKIGWYQGSSEKQFYDSKSWGINATYDNELDFAYLTVQYGYRSSESNRSYTMTEAPSLQPLGSYEREMPMPYATYNPQTGVYSPAGPYRLGIDYAYAPIGTSPIADGYTLFLGRNYDRTAEGAFPVTKLILMPGQYKDAQVTRATTLSRSFSIEPRLASKVNVASGDKYEWIAGALFMEDDVTELISIFENGMVDVHLREYALFGQGSYAPFARINFTGGYRYTWDEKSFHGGTINGGYADPTNFWYQVKKEVDPKTYNRATSRWSYATYKGNISWQATDDIMPYVQYSFGKKTGNVDRQLGTPVAPEELDAYEAGVRTRLFNGKVQINTTGYIYDTKNANEYVTVYDCANGTQADHPENYPNPQPGVCAALNPNAPAQDVDYTFNGEKRNRYTVLNVGSARQKGINVNATWLATANDVFTLTGSYSSNRRKEYSVAKAMIEYAAKMGWSFPESALQAQYAVEDSRNGQRFGGGLKGNVGYARTWFIGTDFLTFNTTGFYTGRTRKRDMRDNTPQEYRLPGNPAYWLFDASISYNSTRWVPEGYRWTARIYGNNIFDKLIIGKYYNDNSQWFEPGNGIITYTFAEPRTLGVAFTLNF
jgi:outer membrane receptor protein involved in Fe transport